MASTSSRRGSGPQKPRKKAKSAAEAALEERERFPSICVNEQCMKIIVAMKAQRLVVKHSPIEGDPTPEHIRTTIKQSVFPRMPFAIGAERGEIEVAEKCLQWMNFDGIANNPNAKTAWIHCCEPAITKQLNDQRSHASNQIALAAWEWMDLNNGKAISQDLAVKCLQRKIDMNNDEEAEAFEWWWEKFLLKGIGDKSLWKKDIRHCFAISEAKHQEDPDVPLIPASAEAFTAGVIFSNRERWEKAWVHTRRTEFRPFAGKKFYETGQDNKKLIGEQVSRCQFAIENLHVCHFILTHLPVRLLTLPFQNANLRLQKVHLGDGDKSKGLKFNDAGILCFLGAGFSGKFASSTNGQDKFGGWSQEGRKLWREHRLIGYQVRNNPAALEVERAMLQELRTKNNLTADCAEDEKKKGRKRDPKMTEEEIEQEFEDSCCWD